jgi:hypothetical protein
LLFPISGRYLLDWLGFEPVGFPVLQDFLMVQAGTGDSNESLSFWRTSTDSGQIRQIALSPQLHR